MLWEIHFLTRRAWHSAGLRKIDKEIQAARPTTYRNHTEHPGAHPAGVDLSTLTGEERSKVPKALWQDGTAQATEDVEGSFFWMSLLV